MTIGVLKEPSDEHRVSLLPEAVVQLIKKGHRLLVEEGAGIRAFAGDEDYIQAGAAVTTAAEATKADVILSIQAPQISFTGLQLPVLIGVYQPLYLVQKVQQWAQEGFTVFSLDMLPRTTRAQSMDVLSSQANIA